MKPIVIEAPQCNWIGMPFSDKRKGYFWLCSVCKFRGRGKISPPCPCEPITIPGAERE
jgi:hypothetical protein